MEKWRNREAKTTNSNEKKRIRIRMRKTRNTCGQSATDVYDLPLLAETSCQHIVAVAIFKNKCTMGKMNVSKAFHAHCSSVRSLQLAWNCAVAVCILHASRLKQKRKLSTLGFNFFFVKLTLTYTQTCFCLTTFRHGTV